MTKKNRLRLTMGLTMAALILSGLFGSGPLAPTIPIAQASSGFDVKYLGNDNMPVLLSTTTQSFAVAKIELFDSAGGSLTSLNLKTRRKAPYPFHPTEALAALAPGSNSGFSVWRDINMDGFFDPANDLQINNTPTPWSSNGTDTWSSYINLSGLSIGASYDNRTTLFLAFQAKEFSSTAEPYVFETVLSPGALTMSGASISSWPSSEQTRGPVVIGRPGSGGLASSILISEARTSLNDTNDFIELYNRSGEPIDLSGYSIHYHSSNISGFETSPTQEISLTGIIPAKGYYLVGETGTGTTTDKEFISSIESTGGYISLIDDFNQRIDTLAYGSLMYPGLAEGGSPMAATTSLTASLERKAFSDSTASTMISGGRDYLKGNSRDSNNNYYDFIIRSEAEPQSSYSGIEDLTTTMESSTVKINEVLYNTVSSSTRWIELYNPGTAPYNLNSHFLKHKGVSYYFLQDVYIPTHGYLIIHWNQASSDPLSGHFYTDTGLNDLDPYGGDIMLEYSGQTIDYVQYKETGYANQYAAVEDGAWTYNDYVPGCLPGYSIGRRSSDGTDTDTSADWSSYSIPTPGSVNFGADATPPEQISNLSLIDQDDNNAGLNGYDIHLSWTPSQIADPSFQRYDIYLLPEFQNLDYALHQPIISLYQQYQISSTSFIFNGSSAITKDSRYNLLTEGNYRAHVIAYDKANNRSQPMVSPSALLAAEAISDTTPPNIFHSGVWKARASTTLQIIAQANDNVDVNYLKLFYQASTSPNFQIDSPGFVDCDRIEYTDDLYTCSINGPIDANKNYAYYLTASDGSRLRYLSASTTASTVAQAQASPFIIDIVSDENDTDLLPDLSGQIFGGNGLPLATTSVFLEGRANSLVFTDNEGNFSYPDDSLEAGTLMIRAHKTAYQSLSYYSYLGQSGIAIYLNEGSTNFYTSSLSQNPIIRSSSPQDGFINAPRSLYCENDCSTLTTSSSPIVINFDRPMDPYSINDQDASDAGSNIYLTSNGSDRIAGQVRYDSLSQSARFYSDTPDTLAYGTKYELVITQNVRDTAGNPITGNDIDGAYTLSFSTISSLVTDFSAYGSSGAYLPPKITHSTPPAGSFGNALNSSIMLRYSEAMDLASLYGRVQLFPVDDPATWTLGSAVPANLSLDPATRQILTIDPLSALDSAKTWWVLRIKGSARSLRHLYMADPGPDGCDNEACTELDPIIAYEMNFRTDPTLTDNSAPTIVASYPASDNGNVPTINVGISSLQIAFSEAIDPSSIRLDTIRLLSGNMIVNGKLEYDPAARTARFSPFYALMPLSRYTLAVGGCQDLAGNAMLASTSIEFQTGPADTQAPRVNFANANDYALAITFSEAMSRAKENESGWYYSVLNPANYYLNGMSFSSCSTPGSWSCAPTLLAPYNSIGGLNLAGLPLSFEYTEDTNTLIIKGLSFDTASHFQVFVDNVRDKSGNIISDNGKRQSDLSHLNAARGPIYDSADTEIALAPNESSLSSDLNSSSLMKANIFPLNALAGQNSYYNIRLPLSRAIPAGGRITLAFPEGFNISNVALPSYSNISNDINGENTGSVNIASVQAEIAERLINIVTSGSPTLANDYLRFELAAITNSIIPKDPMTGGYIVTVKTFSPDGGLLESISSLPFYLQNGGLRSISGDIHGVGAGQNGSLKVYLGSTQAGSFETLASITGTGDVSPDGHYVFNNLPDGDYYLYVNPRIDLAGNGYLKSGGSEPIRVSGTSQIRDINLIAENSSGSALTVSLSGDFSTAGQPDNVDVYASSPSGFRLKTISNVGNQATSAILYLPAGDWKVGLRRSLADSNLSSQTVMPDWFPPTPRDFRSDGTNAAALSFSVSGQSVSNISGSIQDANGSGIPLADVWAYRPLSSYGGAYTKSASDGTFNLRIPLTGTYMINAYKTGFPSAKEKSLLVSGDSSGLVIQLMRPAFSLSGKVLSSTGFAIPNSPVWAWQEDGPGHASAVTDQTGSYTLYASPGTWRLASDAPGIGRQEYPLPISLIDASKTDINIAPELDASFFSISGRAGRDNDGDYSSLESPFANLPIRALRYDLNGNYLGQDYDTMTDSNGRYSLTVLAGIYRLLIWTPNFGEISITNLDGDNTLNEAADDDFSQNPANVDLRSNPVTGADLIVDSAETSSLLFSFPNASPNQNGYLQISGIDASGLATGLIQKRYLADLSTTTLLELVQGKYFISLDVPGLGRFSPDEIYLDPSDGSVDTELTSSLSFTLPTLGTDLATVSGTVYSGTISAGNELANAWVSLTNLDNGLRHGTLSASNGSYTLTIPKGTNFRLDTTKPGFVSGEALRKEIAADLNQNLLLLPATALISGHIYADQDADNSYDTGEGLTHGFVRAETSGCRDNDDATACRRVNAPTEPDGSYELPVIAGAWRIYGRADSFLETVFSSDVSILPATNKDIKLIEDADWTAVSKMKQIIPAAGGSLDDSAPEGSGLRLSIPPNAFGESNAAGSLSAQKTAAVAQTGSAYPFGGSGISVSALDNSGQSINTLADHADLEIILYKADVLAGLASAEIATSSLRTSSNSYWDASVNEWVSLNTNRAAYYKNDSDDTEWILYTDTATSVPAFDSFINKLDSGQINPYDYKLSYGSQTDHFTVFAVIVPFFVNPAEAEEVEEIPTPPSSSGGGGGGSTYSSYCTSVTYGDWGSCQSDNYQYREVLAKTPAGCRLKTDQEQAKKQPCVYAPGLATVTPDPVPAPTPAVAPISAQTGIDQLYLEQADFIIRADINEITSVMKTARKHENEQAARDTLKTKMRIDISILSDREQYALTNFIAYGSPDTGKLGAGERAGVIDSFRSAFGRLPKSTEDWSDCIKIANGRWPKQSATAIEKKAAESFKKIYLRYPNRKEAHDDAATVVIAYGLRPAKRNPDSEKAAITSFKAIFKRTPSSATDWDMIRAIAYSGATRDQDTDKDGLGDEHEKAIGTDPKKADSDSDGYPDGIEVLNGYDPLKK
jgi:hypothetical protein